MNVFRSKALWSLAIGHFGLDLASNLMPMALPLLMVSLALDYARVALVATTFTLTTSLAQPLFGYLADRFGSRYMAPLGVVWTSALISLVGFAPDYPTLLAVMFLAGLGSAAFHPQGAMNASIIGGERRGSAQSIYMLGGNLGFALGPVFGAAIFAAFTLKGTVIFLFIGLAMAAFLYRAMPAVEIQRKTAIARADQSPGRARVAFVPIAALVAIIMLRSWAIGTLNNFTPLLYQARNYSVDISSQVLLVLLLGQAFGSVLGGFVSDHVGRRRVIFVSLLVQAPATYLFVAVPPPYSLAAAAVVGTIFGSTWSIAIVMAQELLPKNMGMASGLTLGLAFVTSAIGVTVTGIIADNFGLDSALSMMAFLPLLAILFCVFLQPDRPKVEAAGATN